MSIDVVATRAKWGAKLPKSGHRAGVLLYQASLAIEELCVELERLTAEVRFTQIAMGYEHGVSAEMDLEGWSIHTGCEGEDPTFVGFLVDKGDAEFLLTRKQEDDPACAYYTDPSIDVAIVKEHGIITSNDFAVDTHDKLETHVLNAIKAAVRG